MPELPEIETVKNGIQNLVGKTIESIVVRNPSLRIPVTKNIKKLITSQKILEIKRRAKYLIFVLERGFLIVHLGMSGKLTLVDSKTPVIPHDHVDLIFNNLTLRYNDPRRFGLFVYSKDYTQEPFIQSLGVEPLEDKFTPKYLLEQLSSRQSSIKQSIMNNDIVVGVGNIYASEALFLAKISPLRKSNTLKTNEVTNLVKSIKYILELAISHGGSSLRDYVNASGELGYFQTIHNVYGRSGEKCNKCRDKIREIRLGQRNSFYCPSCQM